jgi:hypothetical protein
MNRNKYSDVHISSGRVMKCGTSEAKFNVPASAVFSNTRFVFDIVKIAAC